MQNLEWRAKVKMNQGTLVEVSVMAPNAQTALAMLERLYGKKSVSIGPWRAS
jgi:hypothetical protein